MKTYKTIKELVKSRADITNREFQESYIVDHFEKLNDAELELIYELVRELKK